MQQPRLCSCLLLCGGPADATHEHVSLTGQDPCTPAPRSSAILHAILFVNWVMHQTWHEAERAAVTTPISNKAAAHLYKMLSSCTHRFCLQFIQCSPGIHSLIKLQGEAVPLHFLTSVVETS